MASSLLSLLASPPLPFSTRDWHYYFRCIPCDYRHTNYGIACPECKKTILESSWTERWETTSHSSITQSGSANGKRITRSFSDGRPWYYETTTNSTNSGAGNRYRDRTRIYTYTFEQWQAWTAWTIGTPPTATTTRQVEQYPVYRYKSNNWTDTFYNYKRYRYENLRDGNIYYDYSSQYADSMGYPGEWEETKTLTELAVIRVVDGSVNLYGGYGADSWYAANVNNEGNKILYTTTESREDSTGTPYHIQGSLANAGGKKATLLVYHGTNVDPTASQLVYVAQMTLGAGGEYDFTFIPKIPVGKDGTGDFVVVISLEGSSAPIYIATIEALKPTHTVTFIEENGTVIDSQKVIEGQAAILPAIPEKEGYRFIGWDTSVTNVRADMTVMAVFEKKEYTVVFINWDDEDFAMQTYKHGDPITTDSIPTMVGGVFAGWSTADGNIVDAVTDNMVLTARYNVATYTVTFYNKDGTVLETQTVLYEDGAIAPADLAAIDGRVFRYWAADLDYVTEDTEVYPVYGFPQTVETPVVSVPSGFYTETQTVTLSSATPGAKIYYFLYGADEYYNAIEYLSPFEHGEDGIVTNGTLYTGPITVTPDTVLFLVAAKDGMNVSDLGVEEYLFGSGDGPLRGDADCNGVVNAADAAAILRHLVELKLLTEQGLINAKVTRPVDAPVSAADAAKILRFLVQLEKSLEP